MALMVCFCLLVGIGDGVRVEVDGRDTAGAGEKSIARAVLAGVLGMRAVAIAAMFSNILDPKATSYYLLEGYTHLSLELSAGVARGLDRDAGVSCWNVLAGDVLN
ncbi:hypothetical protein MUK42_37344 [Musa troglodytarum]|uniref:Uncharacterized protein n=1 Tax=Musa troglodytarum TaxID=320322 RepID=A0A9E7ED79_9LILI|nr:hypothetical protein MUK42_37344 [Musa troglodytarum]